MARRRDFFGRPKRRPPRVLMHFEDVGGDEDDITAVFRCRKCGHSSGWIPCRTVTEVKRGIPCPRCNPHLIPEKIMFICDGKRHLICLPYTIDALHEMARRLGIGRHWFHHGRWPHYDIPKTRMLDVMQQCNHVTTREMLEIIQDKRSKAP